MFEDLSIVRLEARRDHEDHSEQAARSAECTDVSELPLSASDITIHGTSCFNLIMTWIGWFWYLMKPKCGSEIPKRVIAKRAL